MSGLYWEFVEVGGKRIIQEDLFMQLMAL